ncbi:pectinesterase-like [Actinidia eriantha]|uniref:pectinesterase-like n=1 Tax=Actinidia eriantha TaxID=165200 RepID=UPI002588612E|nr:pectinesterase-like [Actinidia eriantha]
MSSLVDVKAKAKAKAKANSVDVHTECGFTRFPKLCVETLSGLGSEPNQYVDIISTLVNKTIRETEQLPASNFAKLSYHFITPEAQHASFATGYCLELMRMSVKRLNQALLVIRKSPMKNKHDIQTWLTAALTFHQTCKDTADAYGHRLGGLPNETFIITNQISNKMDYLLQLGSNTLAFTSRMITSSTSSSHKTKINNGTNSRSSGRRLLTSTAQQFPKWVSARDRKLLESNTVNIKANVIVAKDGSGTYRTISQAIQSASGNRFVIYVKAGVYKEKIHINKDGITLIGDGKYSTIISGDDSVGSGASLSGSATFTITGDRFIGRDIGFENNAGPQGHQAVALNIASDHSVLYKCSISGYQDTLYALALRQFYRECDIYGTIDFIFGNAAAVFQNCNLLFHRPRPGASFNAILANGRTDPGQNTGFSIHNSKITTASDFSGVKHSFTSYLGRPWKQYSRAVVMQSTIDDCISGRGWIEWSGAGSSSLKTLYFAEYSNVGGGAGSSSTRVKWPGFHFISREEALQFTVANLIAGNSWLPATGVAFISGLN